MCLCSSVCPLVRTSVFLSVCLCNCLSVRLCTYLLAPVYLTVRACVCLYIYQSVCLIVRPFVYLSICLVCLSIYLSFSISLSVYLSVSVCLFVTLPSCLCLYVNAKVHTLVNIVNYHAVRTSAKTDINEIPSDNFQNGVFIQPKLRIGDNERANWSFEMLTSELSLSCLFVYRLLVSSVIKSGVGVAPLCLYNARQ